MTEKEQELGKTVGKNRKQYDTSPALSSTVGTLPDIAQIGEGGNTRPAQVLVDRKKKSKATKRKNKRHQKGPEGENLAAKQWEGTKKKSTTHGASSPSNRRDSKNRKAQCRQ